MAERGHLQSVELPLIDCGYRMRASTERPSDVVVVTVDESALSSFPEPLVEWGSYLASAIERLERLEASAIGLDFLMPTALPPDRSIHDRNLASVVRNSNRVVLISLWKSSPGESAQHVLPKQILWQGLDENELRIGYSNQTVDADGRVRRHHLYLKADGETYFSFPLLLAARHRGEAPFVGDDGAVRIGDRQITRDTEGAIQMSFARNPELVDTITFTDVLNESISDEALLPKVKNRVVIIGGTYPESQDVHMTPFDGEEGTPGVFLVATEVQTILAGDSPSAPNGTLLALAFILAGGAHGSLVWWARRLRGLVAFSIAVAVFLGSCTCLLLAWFNVVFPGVALAGVILLSYICRVIPFPHAYDVFISYRREGGATTARLIHSALRTRHVHAFLDVESLGASLYGAQLQREIESAPNFIIVLASETLDRCVNADDWVRKEVAWAISSRRNVIPLMEEDFVFPPKEDLPTEIAALPDYQAVRRSFELHEATMDRVTRFLSVPTFRRIRPLSFNVEKNNSRQRTDC